MIKQQTTTRIESKCKSIIDLSLANEPLGKLTVLGQSHVTGSDHEIIEREVDMVMQEEAGGTHVVGWNLAAMSQEDEEQGEKLWQAIVRGRACLEVASMGDKVVSTGYEPGAELSSSPTISICYCLSSAPVPVDRADIY
jgi:hypothetical protein